MASTAMFDNSGGSSSSSASLLESVELRSRNKNHQTTATDPWRLDSSSASGGNGGRVQLMEHAVKNGESLMQISLLYSVPVSEIKRVNNIVADQEIHGLPILKVPVSRQFLLRRQLMESATGNGPIITFGDEQEGTSSNGPGRSTTNFGPTRPIKAAGFGPNSRVVGVGGVPNQSDNVPLLEDHEINLLHGSNDSLSNEGGARAREAIEGILDETDRTMAVVRQNLPSSPSLEGGAFHFVDAGAPDNSSSICLIVLVVVILFVLLPLGLTFLEESGELEEHTQQQHGAQQHGLVDDE